MSSLSRELLANPFPLKAVPRNLILGNPLPPDSSIRAEYRALVGNLGDVPVAFIDSISDPSIPATMTVEQHVEIGLPKIAKFLKDKDAEELVEDGYYIGPCVVALSFAQGNVPSGTNTQEFVRLVIFKPSMHSDGESRF